MVEKFIVVDGVDIADNTLKSSIINFTIDKFYTVVKKKKKKKLIHIPYCSPSPFTPMKDYSPKRQLKNYFHYYGVRTYLFVKLFLQKYRRSIPFMTLITTSSENER